LSPHQYRLPRRLSRIPHFIFLFGGLALMSVTPRPSSLTYPHLTNKNLSPLFYFAVCLHNLPPPCFLVFWILSFLTAHRRRFGHWPGILRTGVAPSHISHISPPGSFQFPICPCGRVAFFCPALLRVNTSDFSRWAPSYLSLFMGARLRFKGLRSSFIGRPFCYSTRSFPFLLPVMPTC